MKMQQDTAGQGDPIVLVPGGLTGWLSWEPHASRLTRSRKVTRVQLLNVQLGLEGQPFPSDYAVGMESGALKETLDDLGLHGPIDFAAWSYGALVTLDFALRHRDRVRSLTLIEPPALWVLRETGAWDADTQKEADFMMTLQGDISEDQLSRFAHAAGFVPPEESPRDMPQWPVWSRHRQSLQNSRAVVIHTDDPARLRSFPKPVLLVKGIGSAQFLHKIIDTLSLNILGANIVELPAGHAPHIVSMDAFLERMGAFQSRALSGA